MPNIMIKCCRGSHMPNIMIKYCRGSHMPNIMIKCCRGSHMPNIMIKYCRVSHMPNIMIKYCPVFWLIYGGDLAQSTLAARAVPRARFINLVWAVACTVSSPSRDAFIPK